MTEIDQSEIDNAPAGKSGGSKLFIFLPLILFGLVSAIFIWGLTNEKGPNYIPSTLIDKPVPDFALEKMQGARGPGGQEMPSFGAADLKNGKVSIVNVWASWCVSCRVEHEYLSLLSKKAGVPIYGLNYKDKASDGVNFLKRFGNPYAAVGMDRRGRVGIDFGVYGVPETFVVDGKGVIRYKFPGPVNEAIIDQKLLPAIEKARKDAAS